VQVAPTVVVVGAGSGACRPLAPGGGRSRGHGARREAEPAARRGGCRRRLHLRHRPTVLTMARTDRYTFGGRSARTWPTGWRCNPGAGLPRSLPDGSTLDVHSDVEAMTDEIARYAERVRRRDTATTSRSCNGSNRYEMHDFIDRNVTHRWTAAPEPCTARRDRCIPAARSEGGSVPRRPTARRVFSFQAMYAGLSPYDALAIYAVISYMDSVGGVYFPMGGVHALPRALAAAAEKHGSPSATTRPSRRSRWLAVGQSRQSPTMVNASPPTRSC